VDGGGCGAELCKLISAYCPRPDTDEDILFTSCPVASFSCPLEHSIPATAPRMFFNVKKGEPMDLLAPLVGTGILHAACYSGVLGGTAVSVLYM